MARFSLELADLDGELVGARGPLLGGRLEVRVNHPGETLQHGGRHGGAGPLQHGGLEPVLTITHRVCAHTRPFGGRKSAAAPPIAVGTAVLPAGRRLAGHPRLAGAAPEDAGEEVRGVGEGGATALGSAGTEPEGLADVPQPGLSRGPEIGVDDPEIGPLLDDPLLRGSVDRAAPT